MLKNTTKLAQVLLFTFYATLPIDAITGPTALAKAPNDRNTPITVPFCSTPPNLDANDINDGTTNAVADRKFYIIYNTSTQNK